MRNIGATMHSSFCFGQRLDSEPSLWCYYYFVGRIMLFLFVSFVALNAYAVTVQPGLDAASEIDSYMLIV
jgi:hypothetical protein